MNWHISFHGNIFAYYRRSESRFNTFFLHFIVASNSPEKDPEQLGWLNGYLLFSLFISLRHVFVSSHKKCKLLAQTIFYFHFNCPSVYSSSAIAQLFLFIRVDSKLYFVTIFTYRCYHFRFFLIFHSSFFATFLSVHTAVHPLAN